MGSAEIDLQLGHFARWWWWRRRHLVGHVRSTHPENELSTWTCIEIASRSSVEATLSMKQTLPLRTGAVPVSCLPLWGRRSPGGAKSRASYINPFKLTPSLHGVLIGSSDEVTAFSKSI